MSARSGDRRGAPNAVPGFSAAALPAAFLAALLLAAALLAAGPVGCRPGAVAASGVPAGPPEPVPEAKLDDVEPAVAERIRRARSELEAAIAAGTAGAALADAYGLTARVHHAYDLLTPAAAAYRNAVRLAPGDPRWRYGLGVVLERQGRGGQAAVQLEAALAALEEGPPSDGGPADGAVADPRAAVLLRLGRLALGRGDADEARRRLAAALAIEPACAAARFGLAQAARASGDLETAAREMSRVLDEQPGAYQVHYPLGQVLRRLGRGEEAERHLAASASRPPGAGGRPTCPDPWESDLAALAEGSAYHLRRGREAQMAGDLAAEAAEYRAAVAAAPDSAVARAALGSALLRLGRPGEAAAELERAVALAPGRADYRHDLGEALLALDRPEEAAVRFREALAREPSYPASHRRLAELDLAAGRNVEARRHAEAALAAEPGHPRTRLLAALALLQAGSHDEARREIGSLLADTPPEDPGQRLHLLRTFIRLGAADEALTHLDELSSGGAPAAIRAEAHTLAGATLLRAGRADLAAERFRLALALDPSNPGARRGLAALGRPTG